MQALRVLIIDDVFIMRDLIRNILEKEGHEVVGEAKDGAEGVRLFQELLPDLVTLDINMPTMDGFEAMRRIRAIDKEVPVLTISGVRGKEIEKEMLELGSFSFVRKPFQPAYLLGRIEDLSPIVRTPKFVEVASLPLLVANGDASSDGSAHLLEGDTDDDLLAGEPVVEFELPNEAVSLPDPVFVLKNDHDTISIVYEDEAESKEADRKVEEFALVSPHNETEEKRIATPPLRPEMFATHDEAIGQSETEISDSDKPREIAPPRGNRGYHESPNRMRELRMQEIEGEGGDDDHFAIVNSKKPDRKEEKPSLFATILSLFKKN